MGAGASYANPVGLLRQMVGYYTKDLELLQLGSRRLSGSVTKSTGSASQFSDLFMPVHIYVLSKVMSDLPRGRG